MVLLDDEDVHTDPDSEEAVGSLDERSLSTRGMID
jgi:hypothetical protein